MIFWHQIIKEDVQELQKRTLGKNYCNDGDIEGELCSKCELGYFPDKNGGCSYTENCKISYKGQCIECENDHVLIGLKICKKDLVFIN